MKIFIADTERFKKSISTLTSILRHVNPRLLSLLIQRKDYDNIWKYLNDHKTFEKTTILDQTVWIKNGVRITLEKVDYV